MSRSLITLALLVSASGLIASSALAKSHCGKDCKSQIAGDFKTCKSACSKGKSGKTCRKACVMEKKAAKLACKTATAPTPPNCGQTTTTTSTVVTSSTTSTTIVGGCNCCSKTLLKFQTVLGTGNCGQVKDNTGNKQIDLACGGLYFGGGNDAVPLPATVPDMGLSFTKIATCAAGTGALTLGPTMDADEPVSQTHKNRHCTNATESNPEYPTRNGCLFGAPLPIPNTSSPTISTCVVNRVTTDASGTGTCNGDTNLNLPLGSDIYLTGDLLDGSAPNRPNEPGIQPCPICKASLCEGGPNHGMACTPESSALGGAGPTSHDCPPPGNGVACDGSSACIGTLPIPFALTTGAATKTAIDIGSNTNVFCGFCATNAGVFHNPGQPCTASSQCTSSPFTVCRQKDPGAFATNLASPFHTSREIDEMGSAAGCLADGNPHNSTLVSVFCIPPTFNATVDNAADLPGPGAVALPGMATAQ